MQPKQHLNHKLGYHKLLIGAFLILTQIGTAQDTDFETWSSLILKYEPNNRLTFGLEELLQLKNNSSEVDIYFTQLEAEYEAIDNFEIGVGARYIRENDNVGNIQGYENHFRLHINLAYKHKWKQLAFKYRFRYQNKNELGVASTDEDYAKQHLRLKAGAEYKIEGWKLDPKFSVELFRKISQGEESIFNKIRFTLGTDYKIKKIGKIGLYYRYQKDLNVALPDATKILGFKYTYTFN